MRANNGNSFKMAVLVTLAACSGKSRLFVDGPTEDADGSRIGTQSVDQQPLMDGGVTPVVGGGESDTVTSATIDATGQSGEVVSGNGEIRCDVDAASCTLPEDARPAPSTCVPTGARDCSSDLDGDCDGQADNVVDETCKCVPESVEACDEHPGLDGRGQCQAGLRTCLIGSNLTSDWGRCEGAVGPGEQDSCVTPGDDTDCDGIPNEGCSCINGETQRCGSSTNTGPCQIGTSICVNGAFGPCQGAVAPAPRDTCVQGDDSNCNGNANEGCACLNGQTRACGPDTDVGACQRGSQTCVNGVFAQCLGAQFANPRNCGSQQDNDCDGRPDNTIDNVCQCIPGQGNGPCSGDPNQSRCNAQGQCVPCQGDADCSLVSGRRTRCESGRCVEPLLADGVSCTDARQCESGRCTAWFLDTDSDGFGGEQEVRICGTEQPTAPGAFQVYRLQGGDCCQGDRGGDLVNPTQTSRFSIETPCGGYDWNCNGLEEPMGIFVSCDGPVNVPCRARTGIDGQGPGILACGEGNLRVRQCTIAADGTCVFSGTVVGGGLGCF